MVGPLFHQNLTLIHTHNMRIQEVVEIEIDMMGKFIGQSTKINKTKSHIV